jgi:hypothetical protein
MARGNSTKNTDALTLHHTGSKMAVKLKDTVGLSSLLTAYIKTNYPKGIVVVTHPGDIADIYWGCLNILTVGSKTELEEILDRNSEFPRLRPHSIIEGVQNDCEGGVSIFVDGVEQDA